MTKEILRDDKGRIIEGSGPLNPEGRPVGAKSFTNLVVEAMERKMGDEGEGMSRNEFLAEALADFLTTGTFTTADGKELAVKSADFVNFILSVWKKLEPNMTAIDITTGGKAIDFSRMDDRQLVELITQGIRNSIDGDSGGEEARDSAETSED